MKKICFVLLAICLLTGTACKKENKSLVNTKWKLISILDVETCAVTELEPKDCQECYTLEFLKDDIIYTFSCSNGYTGNYLIDYNKNSLNVGSFLGTRRNELWGGKLYIHLLESIQSFSIEKKELYLYYNDKKNRDYTPSYCNPLIAFSQK